MEDETEEQHISIHALCEEGDLRCAESAEAQTDFYPRPLRGGRPIGVETHRQVTEFLSTPSARRATYFIRDRFKELEISIHALCEEGDTQRRSVPVQLGISIHALCEEGDLSFTARQSAESIFLSTPSARRATAQPEHQPQRLHISIHALCEEGDLESYIQSPAVEEFLSTPSARRATLAIRAFGGYDNISIHALCEEGDFE